jgi:4-hydroxy-tetrahydrodipicolinate reductase
MEKLRVAVAGALGRMGRVACSALQQDPGIEYAGGLARIRDPEQQITDDLDELLARTPDVLLDLTTHPSSVEISMAAVRRSVHSVIGATGWTPDERDRLRALVEERGIGAMIVPNFSLGAVLMMRFASEAARHFTMAEIVELHHDRKLDAPSGTALLTAERMKASGGPADVPIHSVRLRGLVAHQEVLFGGEGEVLTIRHDSFSRDSFAAGMVRCVHAVRGVRGLVIGMETILG